MGQIPAAHLGQHSVAKPDDFQACKAEPDNTHLRLLDLPLQRYISGERCGSMGVLAGRQPVAV